MSWWVSLIHRKDSFFAEKNKKIRKGPEKDFKYDIQYLFVLCVSVYCTNGNWTSGCEIRVLQVSYGKKNGYPPAAHP